MFANDGADVYSVDISSTWLIRAGTAPFSQPSHLGASMYRSSLKYHWSSCSDQLGYADVRAYCGLYTRLSRE